MSDAIFDNDPAREFVGTLRQAAPTAVGDLISGAIKAVAQAERPLAPADVQRALVALALLLSEFDASILSDAPDADQLGPWFADLEIELNPARRQIAGAAMTRMLIRQDNDWYDESSPSLASVHHLRDLLADSGADG